MGLEVVQSHSEIPATRTNANDFDFRNCAIAEIIGKDPLLANPQSTLKEVYELLNISGAFRVPLQDISVNINGVKTVLTVVNASENGTIDMTSAVWIRDLTRIADAKMRMFKLNEDVFRDEGAQAKKLITTCLTLMSTRAQLTRFNKIINRESDPDDHDSWPHIRLGFNNLDGRKKEGWRHNQDAWQMTAITALDALENGTISVDDLTKAHKQFLAKTLPFLMSVGYPYCEDVGSWEEIRAIRSSTNALNWALADRILKCVDKPGFEFLQGGFNTVKKRLPPKYQQKKFYEAAALFSDETLNLLEEQIGDEASVRRDSKDPSFNVGNAALIYLLQHGVPQALTKRKSIPNAYKHDLVQQYEQLLLQSILSLQMQNGRIGGMARYRNDSYYADGTSYPFVSEEVLVPLYKFYADPANWTDRSGKNEFRMRGELVGGVEHEALWLHPSAQLAEWADKQHKKTGVEVYKRIRTEMVLGVLSGITGEGETSLRFADGKIEEIDIPPFRAPESIMQYKGTALPNPNTPLFWGSTELQLALAQIIHGK